MVGKISIRAGVRDRCIRGPGCVAHIQYQCDLVLPHQGEKLRLGTLRLPPRCRASDCPRSCQDFPLESHLSPVAKRTPQPHGMP